jgi:UPF0755 protein
MAGGRRKKKDGSYHSENYFSTHRDFGVLPRSPAEALEPDYAPEPPELVSSWHQRPLVKFLNNVMTLLFVGVIGLALLLYYVRTQYDQPGPLDYATVVVIPKGDGVRQIASRLEREEIISDQRIFVAFVMYFGAQTKLKAGEYAIKKQASMRAVLDTLVEGKAILHSVSVPEGLTSFQVVERLKAHPELTGRVDLIPPEGSIMPDTYRFERKTDRNELIARMQGAQRRYMDSIWPQRASDLPFDTKSEAIILASVVERETGKVDERDRVAAVFVNRLRKNMRLQSDPTIIYGLSGGKGTLGRPLLKREVQQMTPYNTYTIKGLPPTPIANPGRAALEAVLRPAKTNDLFFVADGTGGHLFSETYDDHKQAVSDWRKIEKEMRAKMDEEKRKEIERRIAEAASQTGATDGTTTVPGLAVTSSSADPGTDPATIDETDGVPVPARRPKI